MAPHSIASVFGSLPAATRGLVFGLMLSWATPLLGQVSSPAEPTDALKYYRQLLEKGQVEAAEAELREYLRGHPASEGAAVLHALALVRLRRPAEAVLGLEQFLKSKPDSLAVLRLYAQLSTSSGRDAAKAEDAWKRCARLAPEDGENWKSLGGFYLAQGRTKDAIQALEKAAILLPRSADVAAGLAFSYGRSGQPENAEHWFQKADALNTRAAKPSAMACRLHGQYLLSRGLPAEALPLLSKALSLDPNSGEVQFALGMCYIRTGRLPEAEAIFKKYLKGRPDSADGLAALGTLLVQQGRHREAIAFLQRSLTLEPAQPDVRKTLAQAYIAGGSTAEAIVELERILSLDPGSDFGVYLMLARSYLQIRDESKARDTFTRGAPRFADSADYWRGIARIFFDVNPDGVATEEMIKQLVGKFPRDAASYVLLADWAYAKNNYDSCRQALETASRLAPGEETRIRILALNGMMEGNQERPDAAERLLRDSYAINRKLRFPDQHSAMAYVEFLERYQRDQEAQRCIVEILSVVPGAAAARFSRARFLARQGENKKAIEEAELAMTVAGTNSDLLRTLHAFLARSYFAIGNKDEAQKHQAWLDKNAAR